MNGGREGGIERARKRIGSERDSERREVPRTRATSERERQEWREGGVRGG